MRYGDLEQLEDGRWQLRFTRSFRHPPEKVWRAISEPEHLARWFPTTIEGERVAGAVLRFAFPGGAPSIRRELRPGGSHDRPTRGLRVTAPREARQAELLGDREPRPPGSSGRGQARRSRRTGRSRRRMDVHQAPTGLICRRAMVRRAVAP